MNIKDDAPPHPDSTPRSPGPSYQGLLDTEIGEAGDTFVYDITRFSVIVTRTKGMELKGTGQLPRSAHSPLPPDHRQIH